MGYEASALFAIGFGVGIFFQLKVIVAVLLLVLIVSCGFAVAQHFEFLGALGIVLSAQALVQVGYFIGAVTRGTFGRSRLRTIL